jgi:hypothetical protein
MAMTVLWFGDALNFSRALGSDAGSRPARDADGAGPTAVGVNHASRRPVTQPSFLNMRDKIYYSSI